MYLDIIVPIAYPEMVIRSIGIIVISGFAASPISIIDDNCQPMEKHQY